LFFVKERGRDIKINKVKRFLTGRNEMQQEYSLPRHDTVWSGR
jgi:uncharacterized protein involved in tellurium resistance